MSKSKFKVGDVVYISRIRGGVFVIEEETIVDVFECNGAFHYKTNITDCINESSLFKTRQQALNA
jgi:hypothetical protein